MCHSGEHSHDWISIISKGGLTHSSDEWLQTLIQFEIVFGSFHGRTVSKQVKVISSLVKSKFPEVDEKVICMYVRTIASVSYTHLDVYKRQTYVSKINTVLSTTGGLEI